MYAFESGSPAQPTILFLHGGGLSSKMWQPVIERLPDFHCLAPDLPEHGQSLDQGPFDLDEAARGVIELIRLRAPGVKVHVIGLSLGGALALDILRLAPETVDHTMVTGTSARLSKFLGNLSLASLWMLRLYKPEDLVKASIKQFGIPAQYIPDFHDDLLRSNSEAFNRRLIETLTRQELPAQVNSPLLVSVGEKETLPAKQAARKLISLYPQSTGRVIPKLGHVWALQDPDLFARTVRAWVTDQPLPSELKPLDR